jgi:hypothetical protein
MIKSYIIKSNSKNDDYSVVLFFDRELIPEKCSCSCKHGSFYRFTKKNIASGKWKCRHIEAALVKYKNGEKDIIEKEKEEKNERNTKPIHPIF